MRNKYFLLLRELRALLKTKTMEYECLTDTEDPTITNLRFTATDMEKLFKVKFNEEQRWAIADNLHSMLQEICLNAIDENADKILHEIDSILDEEECPSEEVKNTL